METGCVAEIADRAALQPTIPDGVIYHAPVIAAFVLAELDGRVSETALIKLN